MVDALVAEAAAEIAEQIIAEAAAEAAEAAAAGAAGAAGAEAAVSEWPPVTSCFSPPMSMSPPDCLITYSARAANTMKASRSFHMIERS